MIDWTRMRSSRHRDRRIAADAKRPSSRLIIVELSIRLSEWLANGVRASFGARDEQASNTGLWPENQFDQELDRTGNSICSLQIATHDSIKILFVAGVLLLG